MSIQRVVILMTDEPCPVYHRLTNVEFVDRQNVPVMACGWRDKNQRWWSAYLRREHADLFARPCHTCFKENS